MIVKGLPSRIEGVIRAPQSKSIAIRTIFLSLFNNVKIRNLSISEDVNDALNTVKILGVKVEKEGNMYILTPPEQLESVKGTIFLKGSATTLRFLISIIGIIGGDVEILGGESLKRRPLTTIFRALKGRGVELSSDSLPLRIKGKYNYDEIIIEGSESSQYISGLIYGFCIKGYGKIKIIPPISSKSYIYMTINILNSQGGKIIFDEEKGEIYVNCGKINKFEGEIKGDYALASFYVASSLITGGYIEIFNLYEPQNFLGDHSIVEIFSSMGAFSIYRDGKWIAKDTNNYVGIEIDIDDIPDLAPSIAILASIAKGKTILKNVSRLRIKESDRVNSIIKSLRSFGIKAYEDNNTIIIDSSNSNINEGKIICPEDHRIAMMVAPFILKVGGIIENAECVNKSNTQFWNDLKTLGGNLIIIP